MAISNSAFMSASGHFGYDNLVKVLGSAGQSDELDAVPDFIRLVDLPNQFERADDLPDGPAALMALSAVAKEI